MQPADVDYLRSAPGQALLAQARTGRGTPLHQRHRALAKLAPRDEVRLVLEQDELRVRASAKIPFADELLFERTALEQATPWPVAAERAARWPEPTFAALVDLGAGLGFDALAAAATGRPVLAVERDPVRAALLQANAAARGWDARLQVLCRDIAASDFDLPLAFLDPDQRPDGARVRDPNAFSPPADSWADTLAHFACSMVKLPPSVEDDDAWREAPQEVVSLDGRARERRVYYGEWDGLAPRRALSLPSGRAIEGEGAFGPDPRAPREGDALLDPDASVHHADLVGDLAVRDGLRPLNRARAYLLGTAPVDAAPGTWLRIDAVLPFTAKAMDAWLQARDVGTLTLRKRGIEARAESWRKKLHPRGRRPGTLVLTCDPDERWIALGCLEDG